MYSSASVDLDQRVHLRVSSLDDQEVVELELEAERMGIVLEVEQVGFSLADQRELAVQLDRLRRDEPSLGIDVVALNPDGRVWVTFTGGRSPIVERIRPMAGDDRVFVTEPTGMGFFDLDRGRPVSTSQVRRATVVRTQSRSGS